MKLNEFLNSNQNQWKNIFSRNENFKVEIWAGIGGYLKTLDANYCEDIDYLTEYRKMEINHWEIKDKDHIIITLEL